jgi:hypothetical protein
MKKKAAVKNDHHILVLIIKKDWIIAGLILLLFFGLYFGLSRQLVQNTPIAKYDDILFEIDTARAIIDMTIFSGYHYRTEVHPIYVLMINPVGEIIGRIIPTNEMTAIVINVFFGAAGTALAYLVLRLADAKISTAMLLALIFGFSTSQLYLSIIPDTASLAICTLLITYGLFTIALRTKRVPEWTWIIAGILTLGVTTTNFAQTVLCYTVLQLQEMRKAKLGMFFWRVLRYILLVLLIVIPLSLIQKAIYPSATLFFLPQIYIDELGYASTSIFSTPLEVIPVILKSFFADTVIAPQPIIVEITTNMMPAVTFTHSSAYTPMGYMGLVLWFFIMGIGLNKMFSDKKFSLLELGLAASLGFNLILHSFYGIGEKNKIELFLYTGNLTFLMLMIFIRAFSQIKNKIFQFATLTPLAVAAAINNIHILQQIISLLSS